MLQLRSHADAEHTCARIRLAIVWTALAPPPIASHHSWRGAACTFGSVESAKILDFQRNFGTGGGFGHKCPHLEQACEELDLGLFSNSHPHGVGPNHVKVDLTSLQPNEDHSISILKC
jgi:hypothetical protein